ncbi:serine hydrolase domain-containing protein [Lentibacillus saliphilus]|uniref:serine hydrolase domain-containing protein n=1 Tax=Lentibacillus saliphilus TaxID=2737028 RepID=UPI001C2FCBDE|nr:serine hydrolase domain-containing protein [Lentibacillus saliphilus]
MENKVKQFLQREIDNLHIPGAVIRVVYNGEDILNEVIGYRAVYPEKKPMQHNTVFDIASLTKIVATLPSVLKLLDEGEFRLDDPVGFFLPQFKHNNKSDISVRHLLTHTSGLPAHKPFFREQLSTDKIMNCIFEETLVAPAGNKVIYSDLGFITLYKIIETITNEDFTSFVDQHFFKPMNMQETSFEPGFPKARYAATEYSERLQDYKHGVVHDDNTEFMGGISGHAGLFSTIDDLSKFASMVENSGTYNGKQILSESVINLSRQNHTPFDTEYRGLGWILKSPSHSSCGDLFSNRSYGHTGFTGTSIWFDPEVNLSVILLTNRVHFGRKPPIIRLRPRLHNIIRAHL